MNNFQFTASAANIRNCIFFVRWCSKYVDVELIESCLSQGKSSAAPPPTPAAVDMHYKFVIKQSNANQQKETRHGRKTTPSQQQQHLLVLWTSSWNFHFHRICFSHPIRSARSRLLEMWSLVVGFFFLSDLFRFLLACAEMHVRICLKCVFHFDSVCYALVFRRKTPFNLEGNNDLFLCNYNKWK